MLLVSFLLVIVATIFLLSGLFLTKDLPLIFVSIGCSALAGLVLVIAVLRSRPRPVQEAEPLLPDFGLGTGVDTVSPDSSATEVVPPAGRGVPESSEVSPSPLSGTARATETGRFGGRPFPIPNYDSLEVVEGVAPAR